MRVTHVWIEGYRNIRKTDFAVGDRLVLIGENNSGKSNVLRAIRFPMSGGNTRKMSLLDLNDQNKNAYFTFIETHFDELTEDNVEDEVLEQFENVIPEICIRLQFEVDEQSRFYFEKLCTLDDDKMVYQIEYTYKVENSSKLLEQFKVVKKAMKASTKSLAQYQLNLLPLSLYKSNIYVPQKNEPVSYELLRNFSFYSLIAERDGFSSKQSKIGSSAIVELLNQNIDAKSKLGIEKSYHSFFDEIKASTKMEEVFNWPTETSKYANAEKFFGKISILPNMPPMNTLLNSVQLGYSDEPLSQQGLGYRNLVYLMAMINALERDEEVPFTVLTLEEPEAHLSNENQKLLMSFLESSSAQVPKVQLMYSTHNTNFLSKISLQDVVVMSEGKAVALSSEMDGKDLNYLMRNPNMDIYKLLFSSNVILVEGISEELLIKSYLRSEKSKLNNVEVLSFHKGFNKILDLWLKVNENSHRKIAVIRDFDNQVNAKEEAEKREVQGKIYVGTTTEYTLEDDIVDKNFQIIKSFFKNSLEIKLPEQVDNKGLADIWKKQKGNIMVDISLAIGTTELENFVLPDHIKEALDFFEGDENENH